MRWSLRRPIERLEKQQARSAGFVADQDPYTFSLSATCPPSTRVRFTGGFAWQVLGYVVEYGWYTPGYEVDLTDENKVSVRAGWRRYTYTFTNPYWYAPALFIVNENVEPPEPPEMWPAEIQDYSISLYGTYTGMPIPPPYLEEVETAAEAEDLCRRILGQAAATEGVVCGGIILRNNGNVTLPNQYQPVDPVNRGRSYLFGKKRYGWMMG